MSINHAILGMLSFKSLTGYDLKKIMQESPFMYWSGNNNQIYKALVELNEEGYVTHETRHQEGSPSRKIYTITADGLVELKRWACSLPEAPEVKNSFLVQLAWTWQLSNSDLTTLLDQYEQEVRGRLLLEKKRSIEKHFAPNRTPRESAVWALIYEKTIEVSERELHWIDQVRKTILQFDDDDTTAVSSLEENQKEREKDMTYAIAEKKGTKYMLLDAMGEKIQTEQDALELIAACAKNETSLLLIDSERLPEDFFRLGTGLAGAIMQKFSVYNIRVAVVLHHAHSKGKFKDFITESNRGKMFNTYTNMTDAVNWLCKTTERTEER